MLDAATVRQYAIDGFSLATYRDQMAGYGSQEFGHGELKWSTTSQADILAFASASVPRRKYCHVQRV
ncbi:MAG: hypothetical protein Tsb0027_10460 [Wenzhouxiangellaceae bacterium]